MLPEMSTASMSARSTAGFSPAVAVPGTRRPAAATNASTEATTGRNSMRTKLVRRPGRVQWEGRSARHWTSGGAGQDRKSVGAGTRVAVRVDLSGRAVVSKQNKLHNYTNIQKK